VKFNEAPAALPVGASHTFQYYIKIQLPDDLTIYLGTRSAALRCNSRLTGVENDRCRQRSDAASGRIQTSSIFIRSSNTRGDPHRLWLKGDEPLLNQQISASFENMSLTEGLRRILISLTCHDI